MKRAIALLLPVVALSASAGWVSPSTSAQQRDERIPTEEAYAATRVATSALKAPSSIWLGKAAVRIPPLDLPDIPGRVAKLGLAERKWLQPQLRKSLSVVRFFEHPKNRWVVASQHEKCWGVPWQRQCTLARAKLRLHQALAEVAQHRLWFELPTPNDWVAAGRVVQRVFPGTFEWLMSCSGAEGGHGGFVVYGGGSYYPGAEHDHTFHGDMVGGQMQYMWGTFKGHYRHGLDALRAKGFDVKMPAPNDVRAWLMPMGQAIAAGWARWSGNDASHWSASWGNGC